MGYPGQNQKRCGDYPVIDPDTKHIKIKNKDRVYADSSGTHVRVYNELSGERYGGDDGRSAPEDVICSMLELGKWVP